MSESGAVRGEDNMASIKAGKRARSELIWGWMFILPTMTGLTVLNMIPIIYTIYQSFCKTGNFGKGNTFVGLENYRNLLDDPQVWQSLFNTFKYAIIEVPVSVALALVLAVLLNRRLKGRTLYRIIYFLPMVAAPAATAMVWKWLYHGDYGLLNQILNQIGLPGVRWITDPKIAIISIAVIGIWSCLGYNMILFLSGIQEIPKDYYESAMIDGATGIRQFQYITIPLVSPMMFFVLVTRVISALQVFDSIFMVIETTNVVLPKTQSLVYLFYKYSFIESNKGYGSAIVVLLLAIIMAITVIQLAAQKKWVHYN